MTRYAILCLTALTLAPTLAGAAQKSIVDNCNVCNYEGTQAICDAPDPLLGESGFCNCSVSSNGHICRLSGGPCLTGWLCSGDGGYVPVVAARSLPLPADADARTAELFRNLPEDGAAVERDAAALRVTSGPLVYVSVLSGGAFRDYASDGVATLEVTASGRPCGAPPAVAARYMPAVLKAHLECTLGVVAMPVRRGHGRPGFEQP